MRDETVWVERVRLLLADILQVPVEDITEELAFGDLPQWDSMGHMDVMMSLEESFGVEVSTDTIGELVSVPAICAFLEGKSRNG
jgi:acyl carrier protein